MRRPLLIGSRYFQRPARILTIRGGFHLIWMILRWILTGRPKSR